MTLVPCPVCGAHSTLRYVLRSPFSKHTEKYEIRNCTICDHRFANGRNDAEFLAEIYSGDFYATAQQDAPMGQEGGLPENLEAYPIIVNARRRLAWLQARGISGHLLDIGAGRGFFLQVAQNEFDVSGVELSETAAQEARSKGLKVFSGDFLSFDSLNRFDIVTLWDVLASFPTPLAALEHVRRILVADGCCVLTLPMGDSKAAKWMGRYWPFWIPPVNLHYFSRESLRQACIATGLEIVSMEFCGKRVALSFIWLKLLRMIGLAHIRWLRRIITSRRSIKVNLHDVATVMLKPVEVTK